MAAKPKRYFMNPYPDYGAEGDINLSQDELLKRTLSTVDIILSNQKSDCRESGGDLYVGLAGVAHALHRVADNENVIARGHRERLLKHAKSYMDAAISYADNKAARKRSETEVAFLCGNAGIYVTAAMLARSLGDQEQEEQMINKFASFAQVCIPSDFLPCGSDELFVGRTGYLCGILHLRKFLTDKEIVSAEIVDKMCSSIIQSGRTYSQRHKSPCPLMFSYYDTEYLGAAHGLSSILQILLSFPDYIAKHPDVERDIKASVDFILSIQQSNGNFPCAMDEINKGRPEQDELVHWCHGAPGTVYLMAKAYLHWKEEKYLQSCIKCGDITWIRGLLRKGPGICHGIAGSGYVFLLLYRLTQDKRHLYRAIQFSNFMETQNFKKEARTPDFPYSLYEGIAGTACFLSDLCQPNKSFFPLFDAF